ncbi:tyrosine-protein kinase Btk29A isoform X1 [Phlebotomus papatasi]|uniref:tyrosine-protein kinase Btk29A isoform X1 n=1 Tax=Phlebotomus papatasi TaxID=29031 RepID=UPI002483F355|nr:tyrosine-protein kinase Btk29A isoform X1 [Phlebotomus papatasi]
MGERLYDIIKSGRMTKRSQNKKRFTPVNYKTRWFELTRQFLSYFDTENIEKRRERGRVNIKGIRVVELASLNVEGGDPIAPEGYPFQIGYCETTDGGSSTETQYTLYLVANSEKERHEWIKVLRTVCDDNPKSYRYHLGLWLGRKWSCCRGVSKSDLGCQVTTNWSEPNNNPSTGNSPAQNSTRSSSPNSNSNGQFNHQQQTVNGSGSLGSLTPTSSSQQQQSSVSTFKSGGAASANGTPSLGGVVPGAVIGASSVVIESTMPGGTATPGTPNSKAKDTSSRVKIVVALYPFKAIEGGDLSLEKNAEYEVIDDSQEHWWKVKNQHGQIGYIPSNYVKAKELLGLEKYDWYVGDMSRQRAESLLKQGDKEGCFVVRKSSTKGLYTLSLHTKVPQSHVKHYHIKQNARMEYYLSEKHCCESIPDLINYHRHNSGGLACRLKCSPCDRPIPTTAGLSHDKWEIHPSELMLLEELGSGQFGVVRRGKWRGSIDTAVKMMKVGTMSEDDFIEEAKVMTKLQNQNLVQLYGVCSKHRPIYIVTEYMKHGSLLNYLRRHEQSLIGNMGLLLDMCIQVCKGMAYLERHNYIHRDLAARNCLVGSENVVKVADFGLARYVLDDQYTSSGGTKFPIKWAPPEVLNYTRFSSKSDVWAYGVLMWEVFTCGKMPYGRLKNTEVVERVQRGIILERPKACAKEIYDIMKKCWAHSPEDRPSFRVLKEQLVLVAQGLTD